MTFEAKVFTSLPSIESDVLLLILKATLNMPTIEGNHQEFLDARRSRSIAEEVFDLVGLE